MIKIENASVMNFKNAIRGMRHPMKSYHRSDSVFHVNGDIIKLGQNDKELAKRLIRAGGEHRKFTRQIFVSIDITAPLYWWKEMDLYKIGTTTNSTSTMHLIHKRDLVLDDFSLDNVINNQLALKYFNDYLETINHFRRKFVETKNKEYWRLMIEMLPSSFNQTRTWTGNYENLYNIYNQRKNHKLTEWREFCEFVETLPYFKELFFDLE
jgi:hypothetical protein